MRDRANKRRAQVFYGLAALGWRGSARHWARWRQAYRLTAALAVPLVVVGHRELSLLFAAGPIPGWASTVFPPYFVAGRGVFRLCRRGDDRRHRCATPSASAISSPRAISTCLATCCSQPA